MRPETVGYGIWHGVISILRVCRCEGSVFSFEKLIDLDTQLGPEMKSTGEVLGVAKTRKEAIYKGLTARGCELKQSGGVLFTVGTVTRMK